MPPGLSRVCVCLVLVLARLAAAQDPGATVVVIMADGERVTGRLESVLDDKVKVSGAATALPLSDIYRIDWPKQPVRPEVESAVLLLANGDCLLLKPTSLTAEALRGTWTWFDAWPEVRVPLETARACLFQIPPAGAERAKLFDRLARPTQKADVVLLKNGDVLAGEFQSGGAQGLVVKTAAGSTTADLANVVALAFNPDLTLVPPFPRGARLSLIDGSRLHVKDLRTIEDGALSFSTSFGAALTVPSSAVSALEVIGGRSVPLSTLDPAEDKSRPYLSLKWPYRKDRSVSGGPLRLRGVEHATGLGVHSHSELTWKLDGTYRWFFATVGVDDSAEGRGSVICRVLLDGQPAWSSPLLTGRSEPLTLERIDVSKARSLTLVVEFATFGDVLDHADWCEARLVK